MQQGQPIGGIGESGTPESVLAPGTDIHLHYEVRVGDSFLGDGLPPDIVRGLYERLFSDPAADSASGAPPPVFRVYTVKAGDTVSSVAEQFGLPVFLVVWNNAALETPVTPIEEGQLLRIPGADGIIHRVVAGGDAHQHRGSLRRERGLDRELPGERPLGSQPAARRRDDPRAGRPAAAATPGSADARTDATGDSDAGADLGRSTHAAVGGGGGLGARRGRVGLRVGVRSDPRA